MNISSVVIHAKPEFVEQIKSSIADASICEFHLQDEIGRLIVTIEGEGIEEEIAKLRKIQTLPHVISAEMMYSYSEDELNEVRDKLEQSDSLPHWLNDENAMAEDIKYKGDLKKRL